MCLVKKGEGREGGGPGARNHAGNRREDAEVDMTDRM